MLVSILAIVFIFRISKNFNCYAPKLEIGLYLDWAEMELDFFLSKFVGSATIFDLLYCWLLHLQNKSFYFFILLFTCLVKALVLCQDKCCKATVVLYQNSMTFFNDLCALFC